MKIGDEVIYKGRDDSAIGLLVSFSDDIVTIDVNGKYIRCSRELVSKNEGYKKTYTFTEHDLKLFLYQYRVGIIDHERDALLLGKDGLLNQYAK